MTVRIVLIRHRLRQVGPRDIFRSGQEAVVGVAEEVHSLVPCHLARRAQQANAELGMLLIAPAFLPLSELRRVQVIDRVHDAAVSGSAFKVGHPFVEFRRVVAKHAHRDQRADIASVPVRPISRDAGAVVPGQEIVG